jgi:hypothetical protein
MAVGGGLAATTDDLRLKHTGVELMAAGFALAPIVSHLIAREWKRAAYFGVAPLALAGVAVGILEGSQAILDDGTAAARITFGAALALELAAAAGGLLDSMMAGERYAKRRGLAIVPSAGPHSVGLTLGGFL